MGECGNDKKGGLTCSMSKRAIIGSVFPEKQKLVIVKFIKENPIFLIDVKEVLWVNIWPKVNKML